MKDIDSRTIEAINAILRRGNDVQIRRKGDGYVVMEVVRTIRVTKFTEQSFEKSLTEATDNDTIEV